MNFETFYANLYRQFLQADATLAAVDDLPIVCPQDGAAATAQMISVIAAEQEETKHPMLLSLLILVRLQVPIYIAPDTDNPDGAGIDPAITAAWRDAMFARLRDKDAFKAFLLALPEEERTGGEIMMRLPPQSWVRDDDPKEHTTTWETQTTLKVNISPEDEE